MATIETKFSVGTRVWYAGTTTEARKHPCPDCKGEHVWKTVSPAGNEYTFRCPRCTSSYTSFNNLCLSYTAHVPTARALTIGSVRHDSHRPETTYMCVETGVGSGSVYDEGRLFETEDEALQCATSIAAKANAEVPHIVEQYNRSLEISDYQLENGLLKLANDAQSRARRLLYNLEDLFQAINDADDKDAIAEAVEEYKRYSWDSDKKFAETAPPAEATL